ncbi:unnamed protein product [Parajaminaea phylloscopi]
MSVPAREYGGSELPNAPPSAQTRNPNNDYTLDMNSPGTAVPGDLPQSYSGATQSDFATVGGEKRHTLRLEEALPPVLRPNRHGNGVTRSYRAIIEQRIAIKNKLVLFLCEFVGTTMFLFFSFGIATQASDKMDVDTANGDNSPDTNALLFSSLGFGFSLAVNAWVWFRVTGSLFNPALTLGLTLLGKLDWVECITLTFSQFSGAIAAAGLTAGLFPGDLNARATLHGGTTINQGFWIEFFSTSMLLFTVYMLAGEKHKATFLAPIGIGLSLFLGELLATKYTGGSLNPARSLGPDVVARKFDSFAWIYYVAPYFATLVTTAFYKTLVWLQYQSIVPDMDADDQHDQKQVIRDIYGNSIGVVESMPAEEFTFASSGEATGVQVHQDGGSPAAYRPGASGDWTTQEPGRHKMHKMDSSFTSDSTFTQSRPNVPSLPGGQAGGSAHARAM